MQDAIRNELETSRISTYVFTRTRRGHRCCTVQHKGHVRQIFFAGGHGRDQAALKKAVSFTKKTVAELLALG
jgi:hypothetical protein